MSEVKASGTVTFKIDVPHTLLESGSRGEKPLLVYLHGFGQNSSRFRALTGGLESLEAYHLYIDGPYPIYDRTGRRNVPDWGRAWYLYDGGQQQFKRSMERSTGFIQDTVERLRPQIEARKVAVVGYSMGGYLAGYLALSRPGLVDELVVAGGRIKTEWFADSGNSFDHLTVLALHGSEDQSVQAERQRESCQELEKMGADVTFQTIDAGHKLTGAYIEQIAIWLEGRGYKVGEA